MAKTPNSVSARRMKSEVVITDTINTALSLAIVTPPETVDFSQISVEVSQPTAPQRPVDKQPVQGDDYSILTQDNGISETVLNWTILYTKGADQLGSVNFDFYNDLLRPLFHNSTPLSLQHIWSATGEVGDIEYSTDATETFITSCPDPVGGATSEKIKLTYTVETSKVTPAVIT